MNLKFHFKAGSQGLVLAYPTFFTVIGDRDLCQSWGERWSVAGSCRHLSMDILLVTAMFDMMDCEQSEENFTNEKFGCVFRNTSHCQNCRCTIATSV